MISDMKTLPILTDYLPIKREAHRQVLKKIIPREKSTIFKALYLLKQTYDRFIFVTSKPTHINNKKQTL